MSFKFYTGTYSVRVTLLEPAPPNLKVRQIKDQWVQEIKQQIKSNPTVMPTMIPVLLDGIKKETFKVENISNYKMYTLGKSKIHV